MTNFWQSKGLDQYVSTPSAVSILKMRGGYMFDNKNKAMTTLYNLLNPYGTHCMYVQSIGSLIKKISKKLYKLELEEEVFLRYCRMVKHYIVL